MVISFWTPVVFSRFSYAAKSFAKATGSFREAKKKKGLSQKESRTCQTQDQTLPRMKIQSALEGCQLQEPI
jgi:hypothetical protein